MTSASKADAVGGEIAAERGLGRRVVVAPLRRDELAGQAGDELQLHAEADQRLEVGGHVRRRLAELPGDQVDVPVDEHLLPGHEHVIEDHGRVDLVVARRERVVVDAGGERGVGPARVEAKPRGVHWHDHRERVVGVAGRERRDVAHEEPVGHRDRGGDGVRATNDDARVRLLHDPRVEEWLGMLVGGGPRSICGGTIA